MFRFIAKKLVGKKPANMEYPMYRQAVRCVENTLRRWAENIVKAIAVVAIVLGLATLVVANLVVGDPGYYKPNPEGVLTDGMPYHYHVDNCDICG